MADNGNGNGHDSPSGTPGLGATGEYPEGKLNEDDEGELRLAVGHNEGNVILDFGKPVVWVGLPPDTADAIADMLRKHAQAVRGGG